MARKKSAPADESTVAERVISRKQLVALLKEGNNLKADLAAKSGKFGERIKNAADNAYLDTKAFRFCLGIMRMEDLKQQQFLRNVELYLDMMREEGLIRESQGELDLAQNDGDDSPETEDQAPLASDEEEQVKTNVTRLRRGISKLPEEQAAADQAAAGGAPDPDEQKPSGVVLQ